MHASRSTMARRHASNAGIHVTRHGRFHTRQAHLVLDVAGLALQVLADLPHSHRTSVTFPPDSQLRGGCHAPH